MIVAWRVFVFPYNKCSLDIKSHVGLPAIYDALNHCKKLRWVALCRSDRKRVFADYGKQVTYACVGPQPSRISNTVLDSPPFVNALPQPQSQWETLVWLMKCAETTFRSFADQLCHQSSAPCKEISSLQDIFINCWQVICAFLWIFWWDCIWNKCIPSLSHRHRLHNEHITGIPQGMTQVWNKWSCHWVFLIFYLGSGSWSSSRGLLHV